MSLNEAQSSGPPVRRLFKAYWRYWRGDLREAKILAEAMIAHDPSDRVAQRLLTKIAAQQHSPYHANDWEPSPVLHKVIMGFDLVVALAATVYCVHDAFERGFTAGMVYIERDGRVAHYPLWLVVLFCLLWSLASIWCFGKIILNRKL